MALGRVADTSWLYALFDADDAFHDEARALVMSPVVTLVPSAIMNETLDLIGYRGGKANATKAEAALRALPHFDLWYPVDEGQALSIWAGHQRLSLHDAHVVALSKQAGFPPASFDQAILEAAAPKP